MSTANDPAAPDQNPLQFEQAEYAAEDPQTTLCSACQAPIHDAYYEAGGRIVCTPCKEHIEEVYHTGGSRLARVLKAFLLGCLAALVGAVIYYAFLKITHVNWALIAIVVGLMVGGAVKKGAEGRGGVFYQLMAVFLTYSAIVAMYVPDIIEDFVQAMDDAGQQPAAEAADQPAPGPPPAAKVQDKTPDQPRADGKAGPEAPVHAAAAPADKPREPFNLVEFLGFAALLLAVLLGAAYSVPVMIALQAPISGLIFGFALWEAWKINRKVVLAFNGPFLLSPSTAVADLPAEEVEDEH
jgi:hypothetical protein